jgi:hypothetical protein
MEGGPKDSQERDTSGQLADAQPGSLGPYVTAGEHSASASALDVVSICVAITTIIVGGGGRCGRGQCFE